MNVFTRSRIAAAVLASTALLGFHSASMADDQHIQTTPSEHALQAPRLSMGQVIAKVEHAGYRHIQEIELDDGVYEVEARNAQGQRVELDVHPRTGKVLRTELDD